MKQNKMNLFKENIIYAKIESKKFLGIKNYESTITLLKFYLGFNRTYLSIINILLFYRIFKLHLRATMQSISYKYIKRSFV